MEKWIDIPGWEGYYQVSTFGRVKSLSRKSRNSKERIRKLTIQNSGYLFVGLSKKNTPKNYLIHRLVALSFIDNPNNYEYVNHINGNKTDNRIENLEWCTRSHNESHAYKIGLRKISKKHLERLINWNKTDHGIKVSQFSMDGNFIASFNTMAEASISTGLNYNSLVDCVRGRHKHCGGFVFKPSLQIYTPDPTGSSEHIQKQNTQY